MTYLRAQHEIYASSQVDSMLTQKVPNLILEIDFDLQSQALAKRSNIEPTIAGLMLDLQWWVV